MLHARHTIPILWIIIIANIIQLTNFVVVGAGGQIFYMYIP